MCVYWNDLEWCQRSAYKKRIHGLTNKTVVKRLKGEGSKILQRCKMACIRRRHIFSDEKMFVLQQQFNVQNDRVWSISLWIFSRKINHSTIPKCVNILGCHFQLGHHKDHVVCFWVLEALQQQKVVILPRTWFPPPSHHLHSPGLWAAWLSAKRFTQCSSVHDLAIQL
jgi:hypothetical protein